MSIEFASTTLVLDTYLHDTWVEGGCRGCEAGRRWTGRIKNFVFPRPKASFSGWLEALNYVINCYVGE